MRRRQKHSAQPYPEQSLTNVNLSLNDLGPEGAKSIADAISESESLKEINLYGNKLGPEGAKALGPAIGVSKSLTRIDLSANHLDVESGKAIAQGLSNSKSMKSINLSYNFSYADREQGQAFRKAIEEGIPVNTSLTNIDLSNN